MEIPLGICQCGCGQATAVATRNNAAAGHVKGQPVKFRRGHWRTLNNRSRVTHGMSNTAEYKIWCGMKKRCYNKLCKRYQDYGGRGITMCDKWKEDFQAFYADMGPRPSSQHSIERKDCDDNYAPENCIWIPLSDQRDNRRDTHRYDVRGEMLTAKQIEARYGVGYKLFVSRIGRGWSVDEAIDARKNSPDARNRRSAAAKNRWDALSKPERASRLSVLKQFSGAPLG